MSPRKRRILFIDRDGTLLVEPHDEQVDSLEKLQLVPRPSCCNWPAPATNLSSSVTRMASAPSPFRPITTSRRNRR